MNYRTYQIAACLLTQPKQTTYELIANTLLLSTKTIRNQIGRVEELLDVFQIVVLKQPGIGISLQATDAAILEAYQHCHEKLITIRQFDQTIRQSMILYYLLLSQKKLTMVFLERILFITRPSIYKDLEEVQHWLHLFEISLVRSRKNGIAIVTGEKRRRQAIYDWACDAYLDRISYDENMQHYLDFLFSDTSQRRYVEELMDHIQTSCHTNITHDEYQRLCVLFLISFHQMKLGHFVSLNKEIESKIKNKAILSTLHQETDNFMRFFQVNPSFEELIYFGALISSAKTHNYILTTMESSNPTLLHFVIDEFCDTLLTYVRPFDRAWVKQELFPYLEKIMQKSNFAYDFYNPLSDNIIKQYPQHFNLALLINPILLSYVGIALPSREIASIALLIASVQERTVHQLRATYFYSQGYFESNYVSTLINHNVSYIKIVDCLPITLLAEYSLEQTDLILVNQALPSSSVPCYVVPSLVNQAFLQRFRESMFALYEKQKRDFFL